MQVAASVARWIVTWYRSGTALPEASTCQLATTPSAARKANGARRYQTAWSKQTMNVAR